MNINKKIISFLVSCLIIVSTVFIFNSVSTLKKSQVENLDLFKKEFLELGRESFKKSSDLFFNGLDIQTKVKNSSQPSRESLLEFIKKTYGERGDIIIIDTNTKQFIKGYDNEELTSLFSRDIIEGYLQENILNQTNDFYFDNFNEFDLDKSNIIIPSKIHFRIYNDADIMVGFGQKFLTGKVRIEFIERQNEILFRSQLYLSVIIFASILAAISFFMVMFMQKIIIRPLNKIVTVVQAVTGGDLNRQVEIKSKDEIGQLGVAFNKMTNKLRESYLSLESKIKERTKELDIKVQEVSESNKELEKNKTVIINLLEDFEEEKGNAEKLVVIRTKELSDEKARLLASINSLSMGFAIMDNDGVFIINNPAILSILDIKENSVSLEDISKLLNIDSPSLPDRMKKCMIEKCIIDIKEILFGKKYLRLFLTPVFSQNGSSLGGVLIVEDITEAKILERSRDEFFAVASHELRTPLTAIRGNSEMILDDYKDKILDKDVLSMLGDIDEASIRLIGIVNDFLEISRLEQGNISLKNTNFDIVSIAEKTVNSLKNEADKKNISLNITEPVASLPEVFADKERVEQILFNLIGNSIKFTDKGSIVTSFELIDKSLKVRITDTGKGILEKNESLLFRKFQPAGDDMLARDVTKSTGLGLYISKIIIEQMGGTIGLEKSEQGKGSIFFFTIPIVS